MGFWTAIVLIVAFGSISSVLSSIATSRKPKLREQEIARIKDELRRELLGDPASLPDPRDTARRLDQLESQLVIQERQIEELSEENSFLKRLIDK